MSTFGGKWRSGAIMNKCYLLTVIMVNHLSRWHSTIWYPVSTYPVWGRMSYYCSVHLSLNQFSPVFGTQHTTDPLCVVCLLYFSPFSRVSEQQRFHEICTGLVKTYHQFTDSWRSFFNFKERRPKMVIWGLNVKCYQCRFKVLFQVWYRYWP